ncbi:MAG: tetratricopeptide repeat protein [Chitinophagales bacterium]|nr:tetratricopeptide repeat protein [Chitinophagales bacterium]
MKSGISSHRSLHLWISSVAVLMALLCSRAETALAQSPSEIFNRANTSYKASRFREAADDYEKLLAQHYHAAAVYFNLGNCYYRMDSVSKCILNYERALKLAPSDEDIQYNLKLAKLKSVDAVQPVPQPALFRWWNNFVKSASYEGWGIYALISLWASLIAVAIYLFLARRRLISMLALLLMFCSLAFLALAIQQHQQYAQSNVAVVMVRSAFVKSAPDAGAGNLFMIHEGTTVQLLDNVGEWNKIRLDDGKVGWIGKDIFERI